MGCLTGGTEVTAVCTTKALCHSHNVWGNKTNSLSGFLQSVMPKNTVLSAQMEHAWFWRRAWCKLQTSPVNTNESLRTRPVLSNDSSGSSIKMSESQGSCPIKCQDSEQPKWKPRKPQRPSGDLPMRRKQKTTFTHEL